MEMYHSNHRNIVYNGTNKYDAYVSMLKAGESINKAMNYMG